MSMKTLLIALVLATNPNIDMDGFLKLANEAAEHRERRRVSEAEFLRLSAEPGVIVLDARSRQKFDELHIDGAVNLSFPDINAGSLASLIPSKDTRILIYCNNNFRGNESAFATKAAPASLNLSTYVALYTYGYRNVYELEPWLDVKATKLRLVASRPPM
jgi:phage shock protein E